MKNRKETTFDVRYNSREMGKMREQAEAIAKEQGLTDKGEIDAFRHAYTSAKVAEDINKKSPIKNPNIGEKGSEALGDANEWWREGRERWDSNGEKGNPKDEWAMDVDNNKAGIRKNSELNKLNLSPEEKEKRLREELATAAKEGKLQTKPSDSNQKY